MSTYVREKVLRIPTDKLDFSFIRTKIQEKHPEEDIDDDIDWYLEDTFPDLFDYGKEGKFQTAPTEASFFDYLIEKEWDCEGDWGKTRALYDSEKEKFKPIFQQIDPNINMDFVRLVEFCWYNGSEADDYYDESFDDFYKELV